MTRLTNKQLQKYLDGKCDIDCNEIDEMAQELIVSRELLERCRVELEKVYGDKEWFTQEATEILWAIDALKAGE